MRVVQATRFGGPEVLAVDEAPDPVAGAGEVVVGVSAAEILFLDTQLRGGWGREYFALEPPYVPGTGVAGKVISVGEGVDPGWIGRQVVAGTAKSGEYIGGGYAERSATPLDEVFEVPDGVGSRHALAALHDGPTALQLFEEARIGPEDRVLVAAAAGGAGSLLVQLAHAAGAQVVGAARGEAKLEQVRTLGADVVVDYSRADWAGRVREATAGEGVDVVFDGAGGRTGGAAFGVTARGGRFFAFGSASGDFAGIDPQEAQRRGIIVTGLFDLPPLDAAEKKRLVGRALSEVAAGRVRPIIGQTFPLEQAAKAHAAIEAREATGKTLLIFRPLCPFTRAELDYLGSQTLGRLATIQPNGTLQVSPVGFAYNSETATIDIRGFEMAASRKYHNVADNGRAAFVVDDIASTQPWRVRCLEIRGSAEAIEMSDGAIIRVHPGRIIGFGIDDPDQDVHELTPNARNAAEPPERNARN